MLTKSMNVEAYRPAVAPQEAGAVYVNDGEADVPANGLATNDLIALCVLPPLCVPVDFILLAGDLDGGAGLIMSVGVLNAAQNDLEANTNMITGSNVGQAGGLARATALPLTFDATANRIIAAKVTTGAATGQAAKLRGIMQYRAESFGK